MMILGDISHPGCSCILRLFKHSFTFGKLLSRSRSATYRRVDGPRRDNVEAKPVSGPFG